MTQNGTRIQRRVSDTQELISFRIPRNILNELDRIVESEGTSRTSIIRRAIALYMRLNEGKTIIVPASKKTQEKIEMLARMRECSDEYITEVALQESIDKLSDRSIGNWGFRFRIATSVNQYSKPHNDLRVNITSGHHR